MNIQKEEKLDYEEGSMNVFADLGYPDAEEQFVKIELAHKINMLIKQRGLKQKAAAQLLGTDQAKISTLKQGHLSSFSIDRLVKYLNLLDQDVEIVIRATSKPEHHHGTVRVSYA